MSTPLESGKKFRKQTEEEERCDKASTNKLQGASPTYQLLGDQTMLQLL